MSVSYWKIAGENIARGLGEKTIRRLGIGGKFIGRADDYRPLQHQLARIVNDLRPIENGYATRIYDCSQEIQKTLGSNAAWAAISMTTLGLVKKPKKS